MCVRFYKLTKKWPIPKCRLRWPLLLDLHRLRIYPFTGLNERPFCHQAAITTTTTTTTTTTIIITTTSGSNWHLQLTRNIGVKLSSCNNTSKQMRMKMVIRRHRRRTVQVVKCKMNRFNYFQRAELSNLFNRRASLVEEEILPAALLLLLQPSQLQQLLPLPLLNCRCLIRTRPRCSLPWRS